MEAKEQEIGRKGDIWPYGANIVPSENSADIKYLAKGIAPTISFFLWPPPVSGMNAVLIYTCTSILTFFLACFANGTGRERGRETHFISRK